MIRVGFAMDYVGNGSLGTLNYMRNLVFAIRCLPIRRIDPVLFVGRKTPSQFLGDFSGIEIIRSRLLDQKSLTFLFRKSWQLAFARDVFLERLLKKHNIHLLSHSGYLGAGSKIPTIGWIPDFQHLYFPDFFNRFQLKIRNIRYRRICRFCSCILLSSYDAGKDLFRFQRERSNLARTLHFVSCLPNNSGLPRINYLENRYGFKQPYFYVPNQFWIHKNHIVILKALKIMKSKSRRVLVISTGSTQDHRQPIHFKSLMNYAKESNITDYFKVLGIVPYKEVISLIKNSVAVINPSLFEGWSTSVEEAKTLGKSIVLSDINVHCEQAPERGIFFKANDAESLAESMWHLWSSYDPEKEKQAIESAERNKSERLQKFAKEYEAIVIQTFNQYSNFGTQFHQNENNLSF